MARVNKKRQKLKPSSDETDGSEKQENIQNQAKKTTGKKRKAKSEQGDLFSSKDVKKKSRYNLRSNYSGDVEFVCEEPCCHSEVDREKYEKLGLNTALFLSNAKRLKRKQSHISVITLLSSSDDEETYDRRTADWVATMDVDSPGDLGEEGTAASTPVGVAGTPVGVTGTPVGVTSTPDSSLVVISSGDDSFSQHLSKLRVTSPSGSGFKPLCVSTPTQNKSDEEHFNSFLTNPLPTKMQNLSHAVPSGQVSPLQGKSSVFYFGNTPSATQNDSSNTLEISSGQILGGSTLTGIHEFSSDLSSAVPLSEGQENNDMLVRESQQIPSTSNSPVQNNPPKKNLQ